MPDVGVAAGRARTLPPGVRIRPARPGDSAAIRALVHQARIYPFGLRWPRFLVAVDAEDVVLGCAQVRNHPDGCREVASVAVTPAAQRRGIAGCLVTRLMETSRPPLYLVCRSGLIAWYARLGFREVGQEEAMPPRYRRLRRFLAWLVRLRPGGEMAAIMVWRPADEAGPARLV
jgi:N-acetylglutamate synthase-like GNAT family acetyltransferase